MAKIIGIVAVAENKVIGKNGKTPWNYPEDLKWFRSLTCGNVVVMGRKTYDLIGGEGLEGRLNIVITHQPIKSGKILFFRGKNDVLDLRSYLSKDLFIIGGEKVFALFSDDIQEWFITRIPLYIDSGDAFMHDSLLNGFYKHTTANIPKSSLIYERYIRKK